MNFLKGRSDAVCYCLFSVVCSLEFRKYRSERWQKWEVSTRASLALKAAPAANFFMNEETRQFQDSQEGGARRWDEVYTDNFCLNYHSTSEWLTLGCSFIYSLTHSFVEVFLRYTRTLWASCPFKSHGRRDRGGWPGSCGEACSWLSHQFPFSLSPSGLSLCRRARGRAGRTENYQWSEKEEQN